MMQHNIKPRFFPGSPGFACLICYWGCDVREPVQKEQLGQPLGELR